MGANLGRTVRKPVVEGLHCEEADAVLDWSERLFPNDDGFRAEQDERVILVNLLDVITHCAQRCGSLFPFIVARGVRASMHDRRRFSGYDRRSIRQGGNLLENAIARAAAALIRIVGHAGLP